MKLKTKLVSALVFGTIVILGIESYYSVGDEVHTFQDDLRRDERQRAVTVAALIQDVWRTSGEQRALQLVDDANAQGASGVRWVWLNAGPDDPRRPKVSPEQLAEIRAGREVLFQQRDSSG